MDKDLITSILLKAGLIYSKEVSFKPLSGGVSSDICLLTEGNNKYVIKQALPRLKVEDDWYADTTRNETEQKFILYIREFLPGSVPDILYRDSKHPFFVMEYLGPSSYQNWKTQLLQGTFEPDTARKAALMLANIHLHSRHDEKAKKTFNTTASFNSLRIEPYLITTGNRHPNLKSLFYDEAKRLRNWKEALVHGDFSPKNVMVKPDRLVLLDHEVAWFGDPAFDVAFLLNHLYLKMLLHTRVGAPLPADLSRVVWKTYFDKLGKEQEEEMELRVGRLLLMLMLARVDGKSPVEYFSDKEKEFVRTFVYELLPDAVFNQQEINLKWRSKLKKQSFED